MSDEQGNLPPPPSYEAATQGEIRHDAGQKNTPFPTQAPYPQQPYPQQPFPQQPYPQQPSQQYPQQPYPAYPPPGQYPPGTQVPGAGGYPPSYPMNTPGYSYSTYPGTVGQPGAPVVPYTGGAFIMTQEQMQQRRRKQMIIFFTIGIIMIVVFVIIVSAQMS